MERIDSLITKYLAGDASEAEVREMLRLLRKGKDNEALLQRIWEQQKLENPPAADRAKMWKNIESATAAPVKRLQPFYWWAAAAVLIALGTTCYFWLQPHTRHPQLTAGRQVTEDILPGHEGAVLTLADGSQLVLDSLHNGVIASQNGTQVVLKDGQLAYDSPNKFSEEVSYNIIQTPKGRQFSVVLPDGSKVWLNAATTLKYPTVFSKNERRVFINGEGYFEVASIARSPFRVTANNQAEVEVLGTTFNINSYPDENLIKTTLLEGAVKFGRLIKTEKAAWSTNNENSARSKNAELAKAEISDRKTTIGETVILKPHQEARMLQRSFGDTEKSPVTQPAERNPSITVSSDVDLEKAVAWKNGLFNFEGADLKEMMRQLERWYNINVVYEGEVPDIEFFGEMSRSLKLSAVLNSLEKSGVRVRMDNTNRTVTILK